MREIFLKVLEEYNDASKSSIADHPLADYIRTAFPAAFGPILPSQQRYLVKSSSGQGNWSKVPWVATFDTLVTETAQTGYYITFLFKSDMSGVYINLNQGVTDIHEKYKSKAREALEVRAKDFRARLGPQTQGFNVGPIDLGEDLPPTVKLYNYGNICSKFYKRSEFPSDETIISDYKRLIQLYAFLVEHDDTVEGDDSFPAIPDSQDRYRETLRRRTHTKIERRKRLIIEAKRVHGYVCQACDLDFSSMYGELGKGYIEAHHLTPISLLDSSSSSLDPKKDFAVLCANCHRMIHKTDNVADIESLRKIIEKFRKSNK